MSKSFDAFSPCCPGETQQPAGFRPLQGQEATRSVQPASPVPPPEVLDDGCA